MSFNSFDRNLRDSLNKLYNTGDLERIAKQRADEIKRQLGRGGITTVEVVTTLTPRSNAYSYAQQLKREFESRKASIKLLNPRANGGMDEARLEQLMERVLNKLSDIEAILDDSIPLNQFALTAATNQLDTAYTQIGSKQPDPAMVLRSNPTDAERSVHQFLHLFNSNINTLLTYCAQLGAPNRRFPNVTPIPTLEPRLQLIRREGNRLQELLPRFQLSEPLRGIDFDQGGNVAALSFDDYYDRLQVLVEDAINARDNDDLVNIKATARALRLFVFSNAPGAPYPNIAALAGSASSYLSESGSLLLNIGRVLSAIETA